MAATICKTCNGFGALYPPNGGPVECPDLCDNGYVHEALTRGYEESLPDDPPGPYWRDEDDL